MYEEDELRQLLTNGAVDVDIEKHVKCVAAQISFELNHNHYSESRILRVPADSPTKFKCFFDYTTDELKIILNNLVGRPLRVPA